MNLTNNQKKEDQLSNLLFEVCSSPIVQDIKNGVSELGVIDSKKLITYLYSIEEIISFNPKLFKQTGANRKAEYLRETIEEVHSLIGGSAPRYLLLDDNFKSLFVLFLAQLRNLFEFSRLQELEKLNT